MKQTMKEYGVLILCTAVCAALFLILWNIRDGDGRQGIFSIYAGQAEEGTEADRLDADAASQVLSLEKPQISCKDTYLEQHPIHAGDTVKFRDIITAVEKTGGSQVTLTFPDGIKAEKVTDASGQELAGFAEGDIQAVFPEAGTYLITVTATYKKGCAATEEIPVIVKP